MSFRGSLIPYAQIPVLLMHWAPLIPLSSLEMSLMGLGLKLRLELVTVGLEQSCRATKTMNFV